ncbi:MAG TPA: hypothetical protein VLL50_11605 [Usitatibacter sp.]|nr:hypothetical protein [Usitatibacter sp.]
MRSPAERHSAFAVVAYTLVAIGIARAALIVAHVPAFGYADPANPQAVPSQAFGFMYLACLAAMAAWVTFALRGHAVAAVVHGLLVALLIADPVATLWFNTPSANPASLLGAYAVVASTAVILVREDDARPFWWLLALGLVVLGLSRDELGYLPFLAALVAFPALLRRSRPRALAIVAVGLAVAALELLVMPALRPAPAPAAERMDPGAVSGEPRTLLRAVSRVLPAAEAIVPGDLRVSASGPVGSVADLPARAMSFVALLADVPSLVFATTLVALIAAIPAVIAWLLWAVRVAPRVAVLPTVFLMLVAIGAYSLAATALGHDIAAAGRHNWLGALATLAAVVLVPLAIWELTTDPLRARIAVAVVFGVLLVSAGWVVWTRGQPISIGGIDKVDTRNGTLVVTGWALDPWSVRRVYSSVGGGPQAEAALGIERPDIVRTYPGYPAALTSGYEIAMQPSAWRAGQELRVYAESRSGAITEIARRVIAPRPPAPSGSPS